MTFTSTPWTTFTELPVGTAFILQDGPRGQAFIKDSEAEYSAYGSPTPTTMSAEDDMVVATYSDRDPWR